MNKINFKKITDYKSNNFDPAVEHIIEALKHPSSFSKKTLSQIAVKALVIIGKEGQKEVVKNMQDFKS